MNACVSSVSHPSYLYAADKNKITCVEDNLFIGGTINKWTLQPMQFKNGWWTTDSILISAGDHQIKFANTDNWTGDDWGNATGLSGNAKLSTGGAPNIAFYIINSALYDIAFNETTLGYKVEKNPNIQLNKAMYVAGTFNNWAKLSMTLLTFRRS